jgi:hypothetical protein
MEILEMKMEMSGNSIQALEALSCSTSSSAADDIIDFKQRFRSR